MTGLRIRARWPAAIVLLALFPVTTAAGSEVDDWAREVARRAEAAKTAFGGEAVRRWSEAQDAAREYESACRDEGVAPNPGPFSKCSEKLALALLGENRPEESLRVIDDALGHVPPPNAWFVPWLRLQRVAARRVGQDLAGAEAELRALEREPLEGEIALHVSAEWIVVLIAQGRTDLVEPHRRRIVEEERRIGDRLQAASWITARDAEFRALVARDRLQDAQDGIERALADVDRGRDAQFVARLRQRRGLILSWRARRGEIGCDVARAALTAVVESPELPAADGARALIELARLSLQDGDLEAARVALDRAAEVDSSLLMTVSRLSVEAEWTMAGTSTADARHRAFDDLRDAFGRQREGWAVTPHPPGGRGILHQDDRADALRVLIELHLELRPGTAGIEAALEEIVADQAAGSLAQDLGLTGVTAEDVRGTLLRGPSHGLLVLFPSPERSYAFLFTQTAAQVFRLPPMRELFRVRDRLAPFLRRPLAAAEREAFRERLAAASERLLPGDLVRALSPLRELTVSGDALISALPFVMLELDGEPLGVRMAIDHAPSLPVQVTLARRAVERSGASFDRRALLVIADPRPDDRWSATDYPRLGASDRHVDLLTAAVPDRDSATFVDRAATRASWVGSGGADVVCVVAHGVEDSARQPPGCVLLAPDDAVDDGLLDYERLSGLPTGDVLVLAVCGAGGGPSRRGDDGAQVLAGAAFLAGSRVVVHADSDLELGSTIALCRELLVGLDRGESPAEALRAARALRLSEEPDLDPYAWASLRVVGAGQEPIFAPRAAEGGSGRPSYLVEVTLGLGLLGVGLLAFKRRRIRGRAAAAGSAARAGADRRRSGSRASD